MPSRFIVFALTAALASLTGCGPASAEAQELDQARGTLLTAAVGAQTSADLVFAKVAPSQILHVSVTGHDSNDGSSARPWRTIARALALLNPGQAAYVHA